MIIELIPIEEEIKMVEDWIDFYIKEIHKEITYPGFNIFRIKAVKSCLEYLDKYFRELDELRFEKEIKNVKNIYTSVIVINKKK